MNEQLSLFDIEIPAEIPKNIPVVKADIKKETPKAPTIPNIPTVKDIVKLLDKSTYSVGRAQFLSDIFELGAIAISNRFVFNQKREERYLSMMKRYDKPMQHLIVEIFNEIYLLLTSQVVYDTPFSDYLGQIYMQSETSSKAAGQFFTPYDVSRMCAACALNGDVIESAKEKDEILTLHEPTCGAGGMIIAAADILYTQYDFNYSANLVVECGDIDARCVHMTYLQLSLLGIPAVIYHRDAISLKTWDKWETPPLLMQWLRFRDKVRFVGEWEQ